MKTIVVSVQNGLLAEGIIRTLKESGGPESASSLQAGSAVR